MQEVKEGTHMMFLLHGSFQRLNCIVTIRGKNNIASRRQLIQTGNWKFASKRKYFLIPDIV
jgi:hypothetical protein